MVVPPEAVNHRGFEEIKPNNDYHYFLHGYLVRLDKFGVSFPLQEDFDSEEVINRVSEVTKLLSIYFNSPLIGTFISRPNADFFIESSFPFPYKNNKPYLHSISRKVDVTKENILNFDNFPINENLEIWKIFFEQTSRHLSDFFDSKIDYLLFDNLIPNQFNFVSNELLLVDTDLLNLSVEEFSRIWDFNEEGLTVREFPDELNNTAIQFSLFRFEEYLVDLKLFTELTKDLDEYFEFNSRSEKLIRILEQLVSLLKNGKNG